MFILLKDERFLMASSTGKPKRLGDFENRERMMLRSMPPRTPDYSGGDNQQEFGKVTPRREINDEQVTEIIITSSCSRFTRCKYSFVTLLTVAACTAIFGALFPYPIHASCVIKWTFGEPCTYVMQKFRSQILNWSTCNNCGPNASRCLYKLKEPNPMESNVIKAIHVLPNMKSSSRIRMEFFEINKTCTAWADSISNAWFMLFDDGINYCNLHNLLISIGLDKNPKFAETTSNAVCTQYGMKNCG